MPAVYHGAVGLQRAARPWQGRPPWREPWTACACWSSASGWPCPRPGPCSPTGARAWWSACRTGLAVAGGFAAALCARERSGVGQEMGMSLFQSGMWMLATDIEAAITTGYCHTPGGRRAAPNPLFNFYRTSDGRWLHLVML